MNTPRPLALASLSALGLLLLAPQASPLSGEQGRGSSGGGRSSSAPVSRSAPVARSAPAPVSRSAPAPVSRSAPAPVSRSAPSVGDGGRSRSAPGSTPPVSAPPVQRERPSSPAPRADPPVRHEPAAQPPVRYLPPIQPTPERSQGGARPPVGRPSSSPPDSSGRGQPAPHRGTGSGTPSAGPSAQSGATAPAPSRRPYDSVPPAGGTQGADPRVAPGGTSGGRLERVYDSSRPIDLSGAARPPAARFPAPSRPSAAAQPGLGSRRAEAAERSRGTGSLGAAGRPADVRPSPLGGPIGAPNLDRGALLDRYRDRGALAQPGGDRPGGVVADTGQGKRGTGRQEAGAPAPGRPEATPPLDGSKRRAATGALDSPGARRLDGARRKAALEGQPTPPTLDGSRRKAGLEPSPTLDGARRKAALEGHPPQPTLDGSRRKAGLEPAPTLDGSRRKAARDDAGVPDHERRIRAARQQAVQQQKLERLEHLRNTDRGGFEQFAQTGRGVAQATSTAVSVGLGVTFGACTGSVPGCFWDPCHPTYGCDPWTNWCSTWWWGYCSWGWPCSSWSFGYWSGYWGFGWNSWCGSPWLSYGWCPYPAYYSAVVYDSYYPEPVVVYRDPVVVYEPAPAAAQPAPEPEPAPAPAGEGVLRPADTERVAPAPPAREGTSGGTSANVWLDKGDAAWRDRRYADAVYAYARAVDAAPEEGVMHLILADALFATGEYHYAAYSLRKALELDPGLLESTLDKRNLYPDPKEFDEQLAVLEQYVADHPIDDEARLLLAANYLLARRPAQCADVLESPYAVALRENAIGKLVLQRANDLRAGK